MSNISLKNNNIELNAILETVNSLSSGKEEQEKSIEITENGTTEITPDEGKTLSKVSITTSIEGIGGDIAEERSKWLNRSWTEFSDNELTKLGDYVFASCSSLSSVNLPACRSVGDYAFARCTSLASINLSVLCSIGNYAFQYCSSLTSVNLPVCSSIGMNAFADCSSLTSINLPACSCVNYYTFARCTSLTSINLPVCSSIGNYAFSACTSLTSLTLGYSSVVKLTNINAFISTPMSVSTLIGFFGSIYVPASLVNAYKSATNWVTYADRITAIVE